MRRLVLCLTLAALAAAQDPRGNLTGRVEDDSGAVIPGVTVRVFNQSTGVTASAVTNESGAYSIPYLQSGTYRVEAESKGFRKYSREGVEVRVGETVELVVSMKLGDVAETVVVTDQTPLLETANSSIGQVIDQRRILELPQRGGNPMELALLAPGVTNNTNIRLRKASSPDATSQISGDGAGNYSTEFQIDGVSNTTNDTGRGSPRMAFSPPATAVKEFRMEVSPYDASIGHTLGSLVNISTASGTNEIHGEMHWWAKNSAFDAPNFFNNKAGTKKTVYQDNRYGASGGGPIYLPRLYDGRNKSFWYHAWEGNRWGVPGTNTNTVPTAAEREGDFSALLQVPGTGSRYQIYDPFTTRAIAGGRFQRDPVPNNIIPRSRLDPVAVKLASLYPLPNQPGTADGRSNHFYADIARQTYDSHMTRLDHAFSERNRAFLRFHYAFFENFKNDRYGNQLNAIYINQIKRGLAVDDVIVLSPTLVLNLRYGLTNAEFLEKKSTRGYDLAGLGFSPAFASTIDKSLATLPRFTFGAFNVMGNWQDGDGGNTALTHTFTSAFTKLLGRHNLKFGLDARAYRTFGNRFSRAVAPDLAFSATYTRGPLDNAAVAPVGQELAAALFGIPDGSMEVPASYAMQDKFLALYLHDDFKISSRLTFNVGARYEVEFPITERYDRLVAGFDGRAANPIEAQARANYARAPIPELPLANFRALGGLTWVNNNGMGRSPYRGERNNVMPRFGMVWQLKDSTILRAGYGMFFDTIGVSRATAIQTGFSQSTPIQASLDNGLTYVARNANPFPNGLLQPRGPAGGAVTNLGQAIDFYNPDLKHPYSQRWSFGLQRLFMKQYVAEISYVGSRGTRLTVDRDLNATPAEYLSTKPYRDQPTIDYLTAQFNSPFTGIDPIYGARISRAALLRPYPHFGGISLEDSVGYSWYHSLQARAEKRFSRGYTLQLNYTFSKLMEATDFQNPTDPMPHETIGSLDRPHRLAMSGIWELPFGRGRLLGSQWPAALNAVAGGWQLGGVVIRQAGAPLNFSNVIFNGDLRNIALPKSERTADRWFNTDAGFNRNPAEQLANNIRTFPMRLSGVRADGQSSWDFSILKAFPIREKARMEFRAEVYNAGNHPNFNAPATGPAATNFGQITATAGDARNWQFALKTTF